MKQFLPREKMSKREKHALDQTKRATWGEINPVTRTTENKKTYNRKKSPRWYQDDSTGIFVYIEIVCQLILLLPKWPRYFPLLLLVPARVCRPARELQAWTASAAR